MGVGESSAGAGYVDRSDRIAVAQHRNRKDASIADLTRDLARRRGKIRILFDVGHMDHCMIKDGPAANRFSAGRHREPASERVETALRVTGGWCVILRDEVHELAVKAKGSGLDRVAEPHSIADDRIEDWLEVSLRAGDNTQDLARGDLLLERLGD